MNNTAIIENDFHADRALFERDYISLRGKEGRIYNDEELAFLPDINHSHPLYKEWKIRKQSFERLVSWLRRKNEVPVLLEVGCGNGWLSARLCQFTKGAVTGIDINSKELEQARVVFKNIPGLTFITGDPRDGHLTKQSFNQIVFAASIQYFSSVPEIIDGSLDLLTPGGEIHILDSPFYKPYEIEEAKQRSLNHFRLAGYPEMAKLYFHHSTDCLKNYKYRVLFDPRSVLHRLTRNKNPFYHFCITKK